MRCIINAFRLVRLCLLKPRENMKTQLCLSLSVCLCQCIFFLIYNQNGQKRDERAELFSLSRSQFDQVASFGQMDRSSVTDRWQSDTSIVRRGPVIIREFVIVAKERLGSLEKLVLSRLVRTVLVLQCFVVLPRVYPAVSFFPFVASHSPPRFLTTHRQTCRSRIVLVCSEDSKRFPIL